MPTTVYDASLITHRKRAGVLAAWYNQNQSLVNTGASVLREQPTVQMAEVITTRKQGTCYCSEANAGLSIQPNAPGACGCGR